MTEAIWTKYESVGVLGEGTYGEVHKAKVRGSKDGSYYAIKLLKVEKKTSQSQFDVPYTSLREVSILRELKHPNIAKLTDLVFDTYSFAMIFKCYEGSFRDLLKKSDYLQKMSQSTMKKVARQLVGALDHIHSSGYLHRDLKPDNILYDSQMDAYIGDFGLARQITQPLREYTDNVATRPYRPPELIMGEKKYGVALDVWSLGCTLYEIFTGKKYLFDGQSELENWFKMIELMGLPTPAEWPELDKLVGGKFTKHKIPDLKAPACESLRAKMSKVSDDAYDLVRVMLTLNPVKRPTCRQLLQHPFLKEYTGGHQRGLSQASVDKTCTPFMS